MFRSWCLLALIGCLLSIARAAPSASTFILNSGSQDNFTFSINVDKNSDDIFFKMVGPTGPSWIAAGPGTRMNDALMFIVYEGDSDNSVTVSPRMAPGNVEPTYQPHYNITLETGSGIVDGTFVVNARCTNCRAWGWSSIYHLDISSTSQSFIYAFGSPVNLDSSSTNANLQRHTEYGTFQLDMVQAAAGDSGVPENVSTNSGSKDLSKKRDLDWALFFHWIFMIGSFLFLFPLGIIYLRIIGKVKLHWMNQVFAVCVVVLGACIGIYISRLYNHTKHYNTAHQIIGLILVAFVFIQLALGYLHHRQFLRTQRRSPISHGHIWFGQIVIALGILNGFFGWRLSNRSGLGYTVIVLAVAIGYTLLFFLNGLRLRRKNRVYNNPRAQNFQNSYDIGGSQADIPLANAGAPPAYAPPPTAANRFG